MRLKPILLAAVLMTPVTAHAGTYQKCVTDLMQGLATIEDARHLCTPGVLVKPPQRGWHCERGEKGDRYFKAPGGAAARRDADCGE